jgi:hypothetical protein
VSNRRSIDLKEELIERLSGYIEKDGPRTGFLIDRERLSRIVTSECMMYYGASIGAAHEHRRNEIMEAAPIVGTLELLKHEESYAIAALARSPDPEGMKRASEEYEAVIRTLERLAGIMPPAEKRGAGRPFKAKDLRAIAERLANYWEALTGRPFKQYWHRHEPLNNATRFVHDIVAFVAPDRLRELKEVTEKLVADRRALPLIRAN